VGDEPHINSWKFTPGVVVVGNAASSNSRLVHCAHGAELLDELEELLDELEELLDELDKRDELELDELLLLELLELEIVIELEEVDGIIKESFLK